MLRDGIEVEAGRNLACGDAHYIPFPVSRAASAAGLACDMVLDWANGDERYRWRSVTMDHRKAVEVKDGNPADRPLPRLRRRSGMIFLAKGRLVTLTEGVVRDTASFATSPESSREAGGILLGHHRGPHVEILKCTTPMPGDRRTRFGFVRQDKGHQEIATREWRESGGAINFVGEWHTHPERHPTPSWIDRRSWRRQMIRAERDPLVFIIVGSAAVYCEIGVEGQLATMGRVSQ